MSAEEQLYFDTSALAKWYLNEKHSGQVERTIRENGPVAISDLTVVEMRSLLARRRREKAIDAALENRIFATFEEDVRLGHLIRHPMTPEAFDAAAHLIAMVPDVPLRTLDALHLAIIRNVGLVSLATFDTVMTAAAGKLGIHTIPMDDDEGAPE